MTADHSSYDPEEYWSRVAEQTAARGGENFIAGDDEPYYRYKRERFLSMFRCLDLSGKRVLEVGSGPGGNLREALRRGPTELQGTDISQPMVDLATRNIGDPRVKVTKIDGRSLPFDNERFDLVFTVTVLQHNTDGETLRMLLAEICRVSADEVVLFELVDSHVCGNETCERRPVDFYAGLCDEHGFTLLGVEYVNVHASRIVAGVTRRLLNPRIRREGEPETRLSLLVQHVTLPVTKRFDRVIKAQSDLAKMSFRRRA